MGRLIAVCMCVCAVTALANSAAVPAEGTMVVAKSDDAVGTTSPAAKVTADGENASIKLTEMDVKSEVALRYAHTTVLAKVHNPSKRAQETNFRVILPETAFISGFIMTLDGKSYKAYVKEKEEAKQIYQTAVKQGIGAAHVATKARDSNHFTVSVNVEPSSNAIFNLTYEELLVRRNGVYNHAINLHPGAVVPKLTVTVHVKESGKLVELRVPEVRSGNEIDATKDDAQNSNAVIVKGDEDREATITFTPDEKEQERLIEVYAAKAKESAAALSTYTEPEKAPEGVLGQFVVQYDVERPKDGEILVNDGYFVHFFAPPATDLPPLKKHVVFTLDTSTSMMDRKIEQLREAMQSILGDLNEGDYFSIVEFASIVTVHDLKDADSPPPKNKKKHSYYYYSSKGVSLVPPSRATKENIEKAKVIVNRLQAEGGTNIAKALDVSVDLINKGVDWTTNSSKVTDKNDPKYLEPIIIFLTDGEPTFEETDPRRILNRVHRKNKKHNATIFSLAFGEDADRTFLRQLSLRNGGFMRHIYEGADAALQLRDFYRQISSPLIANLNFTYPMEQMESLTQHSFRTFYEGSELVVAGHYKVGPDYDWQSFRPYIRGFCGVPGGYRRKRYEIATTGPTKKREGPLPLERLWSYLTIKQLLDKRDSSEGSDKKKSEKRALALALKYEFVTPLTSLVVVKPNATNEVNTESVDKSAPAAAFPNRLSPIASLAPGQAGSIGGGGGAYYASSFANAPSAAFGAPPGGFGGLGTTPRAYFAQRVESASFAERPLVLSDELPIRSYPASAAYEEPHTSSVSLSDLGLQSYSWLEPLLKDNANTIVLPTDDNDVTLRIAKDSIPKDPNGDADCANAVNGGTGVCVYISRCDAAQSITVDLYKSTYCTVTDGYAGVCCKEDNVSIE